MKLNLNAPLNKLSYGYCAWNILNQISKLHVDVALWPIGGRNHVELDTAAYPDAISVVNSSLFNADYFDRSYHKAPSLRLFHQHLLAEGIGSGKRIGFPIFELNRFTEQEKNHLGSVDEVWVASKWAKDIVEDQVDTPCKVVPLGYDPMVFKPYVREDTSDLFVVGNIGKLEKRKGHDVIVGIFNEAFEPKDNVELWLGLESYHTDATTLKEYKKTCLETKLGSKIKFIPRMDSQVEVNKVINNFDVGLFPSRAEGWNLELLECLACNVPCIATNYSAHTEFCKYGEVALVDCHRTESAVDGKWFYGTGDWAHIGDTQIDDFVDHLRWRFTHRTRSPDHHFAKTFTWQETARRIKDLL